MTTRYLTPLLPLLALIGCTTPAPTGPEVGPDLQVSPPAQLPCLTCSPTVRFFSRPFDGQLPALNLFDHESGAANGRSTFFWGEQVGLGSIAGTPVLIEGHRGYDWKMPIGTAIFAAAGGRVIEIIDGNPAATCPFPAQQLTQQRRITLQHTLPDGTIIRTRYDHLNAIQVSLNETVLEGQQIGLSGQTGCARGPHLHFEVLRVTGTASGQPTPIDPFGWQNRNGSDPWKAAANGAESIMLWKSSQVPETRLTVFQPIAAGFNAGITSVAWMGVDDTRTPKNEELILTFNGGPDDVFRIAAVRGDRSGVNHQFAARPTLSATRQRLHIFSGSGIGNDTMIYLNRAPIWDNNFNDCARIVFANGNQVRLNLGNGCP